MCAPLVWPFQRATRAKPCAMSSISTSSGEGSSRSSRRPDSMRCQARGNSLLRLIVATASSVVMPALVAGMTIENAVATIKRSKELPRAWQRMLSGRRLDLLDPSPLDVEIEDIAHGLARVARWNGQTKGAHAFSVAQHCVLVERLSVHIRPALEARWRLAALLHDASEYVIGDMISPFKAALGFDYRNFEERLETA